MPGSPNDSHRGSSSSMVSPRSLDSLSHFCTTRSRTTSDVVRSLYRCLLRIIEKTRSNRQFEFGVQNAQCGLFRNILGCASHIRSHGLTLVSMAKYTTINIKSARIHPPSQTRKTKQRKVPAEFSSIDISLVLDDLDFWSWGIAKRKEFTVRELHESLLRGDHELLVGSLSCLGPSCELPDTRTIGAIFQRIQNRLVYGGNTLIRGQLRGGVYLWRVEYDRQWGRKWVEATNSLPATGSI